MASCAVCLQPIYTGQAFAIEGTEAFHRTCVRSAYRSQQRLAEQRVRELEVQAQRLRNEVTNHVAQVIQLEASIAALRSNLDRTEERLRLRQGELQGARNQNAALRAELAQKSSQSEGQNTNGEDPALDSTAVRFSLLELDDSPL